MQSQGGPPQGGSTASEHDQGAWNAVHLGTALGIVIAIVIAIWVPLLDESFWLDETGTWWFARSSFLDAIDRATRFQAGSFLFHAIEWPFAAVFGRNEVALRIPSLLASLGSTWLIYRLGSKLFDRGVGALAAVCFVPMTWVVIQATDARPYALAVTALIGAALAFVDWLETAERRAAVAYVLLVAATVYLHYFIAIGLLAHVWYLAYRLDTGTPVTRRQMIGVYAAIVALLLPLVPNLMAVIGGRDELSSPDAQSTGTILSSLIPPRHLLAGALVLIVAAGIWGHRSFRGISMREGSLSFLAAWTLLPFLTLLTIALVGGANVTATRYFTSVLPAVALIAAATIRGIGAAWPQIAIAGSFAMFAIWTMDLPPYLDEDWRAAAQIVNANISNGETPVLMQSGFIEGEQIDWLTDPERSDYLNAPAAMYPLEGKVEALPFDIDGSEDELYLESLTTKLDDSLEFILLVRGAEPYSAWFGERMGPKGYTSTSLANLGGQIQIFLFERTAGSGVDASVRDTST